MTPEDRKRLWEAIDRYIRTLDSHVSFQITALIENIETAAIQAQFRQIVGQTKRFLDLEGWTVESDAGIGDDLTPSTERRVIVLRREK